MFTGIIEELGQVLQIRKEGTNYHFKVRSNMSASLKPDQSVSHNGVCLTVTKVDKDEPSHEVTAILETMQKSNLQHVQEGHELNLERALQYGGRMDGHFVQGHVDGTATCIVKKEEGGSWLYTFRHPVSNKNLVVEKGSVCINGVSLTAFDVKEDVFSVAIIPYTYEHTTFHDLEVDHTVNIEYDIFGKYILKYLNGIHAGK